MIKLLFTGGPVDFQGRFYQLRQAPAFPAPSPSPRVIVGGETPAGARIAARFADGLTTFASQWERVYPEFVAELSAAGRRREDVSVLVAADLEEISGSWSGGAEPDMLKDLGAVASRWRDRGADELVLHWVKPDQLDAVIAAGERAGLGGS